MRTRWGALPDAQREGIKTYCSNLIIKISTDEKAFRAERTFLNKLNLVRIMFGACHVFVLTAGAGVRSGLQLLEVAAADSWARACPCVGLCGGRFPGLLCGCWCCCWSSSSSSDDRVGLPPGPAQVLVDILKQDWPHKWPSFIPDIVGASKTNETLCENSMAILRLLSEEVFDFSKESLTAVGGRNMGAKAAGAKAAAACTGHLTSRRVVAKCLRAALRLPAAARSAGVAARCVAARLLRCSSVLSSHMLTSSCCLCALRRPRQRSSRAASTSSLALCTSCA